MENATKALMIAGAVLLAIMIIAAGMLIFNQSNDVMGGVGRQVDKQKIDMFNSKFISYEGERKSGSDVKALISTVITNNSEALANGSEDEETVELSLDGESKTDVKDLSALRVKANTGKKYNVSIEEYYPSGYIKKITVVNVNSSSLGE